MNAATNLQLGPGFKRPRRTAFSLIELLIVVALMTILAGVVLPRFEPTTIDHLQNAAKIVASDISYARNLAVTNGSSYRLSFDLAENRYTLEHVGANPLLNDLPPFIFDSAVDNPRQQVTDFDELPHITSAVSIVGLHEFTAGEYNFNWSSFAKFLEPIDQLQFGPLGETSAVQSTIIWLAAGSGANRMFVPIRLAPISGNTTIGKPLSYASVNFLFADNTNDPDTGMTGAY